MKKKTLKVILIFSVFFRFRNYLFIEFTAQKSDFPRIACMVVRCFEDERQIFECRMVNNAYDSIKTDFAVADFFVTVFMTAAFVFTVVQMNGF